MMMNIALDTQIISTTVAKIQCVICGEFKKTFRIIDDQNEQGLCADCLVKIRTYEQLEKATKEVLERYYVETLPMYMKEVKKSYIKLEAMCQK